MEERDGWEKRKRYKEGGIEEGAKIEKRYRKMGLIERRQIGEIEWGYRSRRLG